MKIAAFFDVDGTLLNLNTMSSFYWYYYRHCRTDGAFPFKRLFLFANAYLHYLRLLTKAVKKDERMSVNKTYYARLNGVNESEYKHLVDKWFSGIDQRVSFNKGVIECLYRHLESEHIVVLVSGSHMPLIQPYAKKLSIKHVIGTRVEVVGGCYTGRILNPLPVVGMGKAVAIKEFSEKNEIDLSYSYAYSDHISDSKMLETVGNPYAVIGDKRLMTYARLKEWNIIRLYK